MDVNFAPEDEAFRAEVRRWFYEDHPLSVFPLVPMSAEPCA